MCVLASAVDDHVQMSEGVISGVMDFQSVDRGFSSVLPESVSYDAGTSTDSPETCDASSMTTRPCIPSDLAIADMVASLAMAGPPMGAMRLAFRAANLLGIDVENIEARNHVQTAASAALQMERLITTSLLRTLVQGLTVDPTGASSLAAIGIELASRRARRLESDGVFYDDDPEDVPAGTRPAIEEPAIVIDTD